MTDGILLHQRTDKQLRALLKNPPHAVLIIGSAGAGKRMLGAHLSAKLLGVAVDKLLSQPYYKELVRPAGKSEIPIESVREIIKELRLKSSGRRRVVFIDEAHSLSEEAQNALLKVIEEPPANTIFILTTSSRDKVLPTITSRAQKISVFPTAQKPARDFFGEFETSQVDSAWSLARGNIGLLTAILRDKDEHELKIAVDQAKLFLTMDRFERLIYLDKISADKPALGVFLDALGRLYAALSDSAVAQGNTGRLAKLLNSRRQLQTAIENLDKNVSPRLICLNLALSLSL